MVARKIIHCIGDSHASFFSGYDEIQPEFPGLSRNRYSWFKCYRLGAVLAYNLTKFNTKERGREKLLQLISMLRPGSHILLCFGEIDCRCHLVKQAELQKKSLSTIVLSCVNEYLKVIKELKELGFEVSVWNVLPTSQSFNPTYPFYGTEEERNYSAYLFNNYLEETAQLYGFTFVSIYKYLVRKNYKTKSAFFFDDIHLGQIAMPLALYQIGKKYPDLLPYSDLTLKTKKVLIWFCLANNYVQKVTTAIKSHLKKINREYFRLLKSNS